MRPFHLIDPSRLPRYVTSTRTRCAIAAAYSSRLNPRNLEVDYYPAYNHTLADLVDFEFDGALTVRQQYNLWLSKSTFDLDKLPPGVLDPDNENYYQLQDNADDNEDGNDDEDSDDDESDSDSDNYGEDAEEAEIPVPGEDGEVEVDEARLDIDLSVIGTPPSSPPMSSSPPPDAPTSSRPRRNIKPPPREPQDFLLSSEARDALNPKPGLTKEEFAHALSSKITRDRVVNNLSDATEADISLETIATVPDTKGRELFPDMLLCHSYAVDMDEPNDPRAVLGWERRARCKISHHCFPLIMEIKPCPRRSLRDAALTVKLRKWMSKATGQLYSYLCAYFARDLCATSVIAMIASGPYWQSVRVQRHQVGTSVPIGPGNLGLSPVDIKLKGALTTRLNAASTYVLGSEASDEELTRLRNKVLIPLIESHRKYPSTMVPNPQRLKKEDDDTSSEDELDDQ